MKIIVVVVAALFLLPGALAGCGNSPPPPEIEKPFAAIKQHDTRVVVICRDSQGQYFKKSLHKSELVTCGDLTFRLEDFARICEDHYVALPGQEKEFEEYLRISGED